MYLILFIAISIASYWVQRNFQNKMEKYSRASLAYRMTGAQVAQQMLHAHGIYDVTITCTPGSLTDHYNPTNKTVNLSQEVYNGCSIAAAAVATHECGHAVQHATGYAPVRLRSALVPAVNLSSRICPFILLGGILLVQSFPSLLLLGIILFAVSTLFSFVTLPVEIDASQRAIKWLDASGIAAGGYNADAKDALKSAAYTYVVAALASLGTLLYYLMIYNNRR